MLGGGARGEEKRRPDGTSAPEGWLGEVRVSRARRDPWGLEDQGGNAAVSPAHAGPGKPAGLPGLVLCLLGPPPAVWVLGSWWGGGGRGEVDGGGPSGIRGSGELQLAFPCPRRPWKACWGPGPGSPPSEAPSGRMGPRGVGGSGGRRVEANRGRTLQEQRIAGRGGGGGTFPPLTRPPGSMLRSWPDHPNSEAGGTPGPLCPH